MTEWLIEIGYFLRSILLRWINAVGGAAIAFMQIWYTGKTSPVSPWEILATCFILASFLAWRDEYRKVITKNRRATLYKIRDLIQTTTTKQLPERFDSLGALVKYSDELNTERDVNWICDALKLGGHEHPFQILDKVSNKAFLGRRLQFLQEARGSKLDIKRASSAISFALKTWSQKERYIKGHREYIG